MSKQVSSWRINKKIKESAAKVAQETNISLADAIEKLFEKIAKKKVCPTCNQILEQKK